MKTTIKLFDGTKLIETYSGEQVKFIEGTTINSGDVLYIMTNMQVVGIWYNLNKDEREIHCKAIFGAFPETIFAFDDIFKRGNI